MRISRDVPKEKRWIGAVIFDLGYHYAQKVLAPLFAYSCMFTLPITSIFLCTGWLMGNGKIRRLLQEVAVNHFFGQAVTEINPVTS